MSVPRGTLRTPERTSRVSARVPAAVNATLDDLVAELRRRGLGATRTELVELAITRLVDLDADALEQSVRTRRANAEGATR